MSVFQLQSRRSVTLGTSLAIIVLFWLGYTNVDLSPRSATSGCKDSLQHDLLDDVANATLGKIFIINLASRTDRRDAASLAARFTGLEVEFIDAVTKIDAKAWPPGAKEANLNAGSAGAWRSHMNVINRIVEQNISSALILEDDIDWDIRIKSQMQDFARASRLLVQPLPGTTDKFLDPTYPQPDAERSSPTNFNIDETYTGEPSSSPYGDLDRWDILWVGHCGCRFPWAADKNVPLGRAVINNDETVPPRRKINIEFGDNQLIDGYPDHTRVVARSRVNTCTLGYGISQPGARRLLYELGVHKISGPTDMMFRSVCDGVDGRDLMICLSPQPALFNHHRPAGSRASWSDINENDESAYNEIPETTNIRWATRVNFPKLVKGQTDYIDLYKDNN
nr:hypothetical protein CFP56_11929 [Quercus suber]